MQKTVCETLQKDLGYVMIFLILGIKALESYLGMNNGLHWTNKNN